jgi:hypothetical protein
MSVAFAAEIPDSSTSAITLLSSVHGRDRRALRQIGVRDLQAAVKYGTKSYGYPDRQTGEIRYKFTHANIVYITGAHFSCAFFSKSV